ncbi:MAG: hypothetical protein ACI35O_10320 [Bacillaceae bacterium]
MKQPKIKIFGDTYNVNLIEFNDNGIINRVVYQVNQNRTETVFKGDEIDNDSLTTKRKIQKPTKHPYHEYAYAPDLESLLV